MRDALLQSLRCTSCGSPLTDATAPGQTEALRCLGCGLRVAVIAGIPRFVDVPVEERASYAGELRLRVDPFQRVAPIGPAEFHGLLSRADLAALAASVALDAGCGMGRHARQMARYAQRVVAVDFSRAIDQASHNVADLNNVDCVQADLLTLPFGDETFDYVYSLGVLHHIDRTEEAIAGLIRKVRPGGRLRVYLYWRRHGWQGRLLSAVTMVRRVTTEHHFRCYVPRVFC